MSVSVCIALLAASAAVSSAYAANENPTTSSAISSTNLAYAALVEGRNNAAIVNYSTAIESRKLPTEKLARSLLNRALAFQNSGKYKSAINDYSAAIRLDALSPRMRAVALYNRGLAHRKSGSPAMAIEDFTGALLLDPKFSQSYYSRANVLRSHGQYLLAISDYKKARRFKHSRPHLTYFGEALTYEALNQHTRAKTLLLKAIASKPDFAAARKKLVALGGNVRNVGSKQAMVTSTIATPTLPRQPIQIALVNPTSATDNLITGSITPSQPDLIIRKTSLPAPVSVPKNIGKTHKLATMPALPKAPTVVAKKVAKVAIVKKTKTTKPISQPLSGWMVQISSQRNSNAAWDVWKNLSTRYSSLLNSQKAAVIKADLGTRGIYYRLRIHQLDSKKQAARLCRKLKRKGQGCFVTKA